MKKNPFGKKGDFITAPNISRLYSEMIAIWIISLWQSLGSPKKFNLIELGAGNGQMMKVFIESFQRFPFFLKSSILVITEISDLVRCCEEQNKENPDSSIGEIPNASLSGRFFKYKKTDFFEQMEQMLKTKKTFL